MVHLVQRLDLDVAEIVRLYLEEGLRGPAIARHMGCSDAVIYARLAEAGVLKTRRAPLDESTVTHMYVDVGLSAYRIGQRFCVAQQTVCRHLRIWGVPLRSEIEAKQPLGRST